MERIFMKIYDKNAALELVGGDEELLKILIDSFLEETFQRSKLEKMISEEKFNEAASYVHATKGAARQLCMEKLKNTGQTLEDVLRKKTMGDIPSLIDEIFSDYEEVLRELKKI